MAEMPPPLPVGIAPDGVYLRLVTTTGEVLGERSLRGEDTGCPCDECNDFELPEPERALIDDWLQMHPDEKVALHLFDGDTGEPAYTLTFRPVTEEEIQRVRLSRLMPPGHGIN